MKRFYFQHDLNSRADQKVVRMIRKDGWAAYGLYWALIEMLYENGGKIGNDYEHLAYDLRADFKLVKSICEESELFYRTGATSFGSRSVDRRLQERRERSKKAAESGKMGGEANAKRLLSECLATEKLGEERKGEDKKQKVELEANRLKAFIASAADRHAI